MARRFLESVARVEAAQRTARGSARLRQIQLQLLVLSLVQRAGVRLMLSAMANPDRMLPTSNFSTMHSRQPAM